MRSRPLEVGSVGQRVGGGGTMHQSTRDACEDKRCTQLRLYRATVLCSHARFMELGSFFLI